MVGRFIKILTIIKFGVSADGELSGMRCILRVKGSARTNQQ